MDAISGHSLLKGESGLTDLLETIILNKTRKGYMMPAFTFSYPKWVTCFTSQLKGASEGQLNALVICFSDLMLRFGNTVNLRGVNRKEAGPIAQNFQIYCPMKCQKKVRNYFLFVCLLEHITSFRFSPSALWYSDVQCSSIAGGGAMH